MDRRHVHEGARLKTYKWEQRKSALECRVWCPKCGASNIIWARDDQKFWSDHGGIPTVRYCDKCSYGIRLIRRESGVDVLEAK